MAILFASPDWSYFKDPLKRAFEEQNLEFDTVSTDLNISKAEVEFIIYSPNSKLKDFSGFKNLKGILNLWAGVDDIIYNKTIKTPIIRLIDEGLTQGMREWCLAHVLRYHLSLDTHILNQDGVWRSELSYPLATERTIGILGMGVLGSQVGKSLSQIGFNVHGWSSSKKRIRDIKCHSGDDGLKTILKLSEILVLLLPLTPSTKNIINSKTLRLLPRGAILINPGRGLLINDDHLLDALNRDQIAGATLDVFSKEPLPSNHPFWTHKKVTVTPHIAATTRPYSAAKSIVKSIIKVRQGNQPKGMVNRYKLY